MKNILAIEIKDNKTIITLTKLINGKHNLMHHKSYDAKPSKNSSMYDNTIIPKIKNDLVKNNLFNTIDETYLTINTKRTIVQTFKKEFKYDTNLEDEKQNISKALEAKYPSLKVIELVFSDTSIGFTKKKVNVTVEFIEENYLSEILKKFKFADMGVTKLVPTIKVIESLSSLNAGKEEIVFSILVEEKFTQLATVENGAITFSTKWKTGLNNIYEYISSVMSIDKQTAKKLFKSFGSIPPEDVVDDKVVHSIQHGKGLEIFTKKDVSKYITEMVNDIFSNVKTQVDLRKKDKKVKIIFNGEIKSLTGFKKYAKKSFAEKNIERFGTKIIGLNNETEFITTGILKNVEVNEVKKKIGAFEAPKISILNKFTRMYNYI